jgi:hypothetical protein
MAPIVTRYAHMWPREVFGRRPSKIIKAQELDFLEVPGVYVLYRDDRPYYIGKANRLAQRLWDHAITAEERYFHFWNFFSAFAVADSKNRNELEGILIAAMPTANSARPKLPREKMPLGVRNLLRVIYKYRER